MRSRGFFFNTSSWYDLFSLVVVVAWFEVRRLYEEQLIAINLLPIYLDELGNPEEQPVAISLLSLTIASEAQMVTQAKQLIERVRAQEPSPLPKDDIIDVITTIAVYKFVNLSRVEVETMLGIDLEQTRVYQEAKAEGREEGREGLKLELVPRLLARGMTQLEVAEILGLTLEQVRQIAQEES